MTETQSKEGKERKREQEWSEKGKKGFTVYIIIRNVSLT